jgi:hypothetical protein
MQHHCDIIPRSVLPKYARRAKYPLNSSQKVAVQILMLLAEDAHLETKPSYQGEQSWTTLLPLYLAG